ncbi:MAG: DUF4261 domain-containing protein [Saprospiraceae bacterium]|nr:DUF4261 domain-containing protein [Saprospiraceae bacterium]
MGLFDLFKKKEVVADNKQSEVLLAMPLFTQGNRYQLNAVLDDLKNHWSLNVSFVQGDDDSAVFAMDGENIALAFMSVPIPGDEVAGCAQLAYNWKTAMEDLKEFSGHAIVSILAGKKSALERAVLLTKVLASILRTSKAVGVYQGNQSLLIPKNQYLSSAEELKEGSQPIDLWIYLGLRKTESGNSLYTYGLKSFDKVEMEIIDSKLGLDELYGFITNICSYLIENDVTFKHGETLGYTEDQKIKITLSKGHFLEGQTLKLDM